MKNSARFAALAALGLGLAACTQANVQPPAAGTQRGSAGESAARQAVDAIPQEQRQGTTTGPAAFGGTVGGGQAAGRPTITRSGPGTGDLGGVPQEYRPPVTDRPRGGGG